MLHVPRILPVQVETIKSIVLQEANTRSYKLLPGKSVGNNVAELSGGQIPSAHGHQHLESWIASLQIDRLLVHAHGPVRVQIVPLEGGQTTRLQLGKGKDHVSAQERINILWGEFTRARTILRPVRVITH